MHDGREGVEAVVGQIQDLQLPGAERLGQVGIELRDFVVRKPQLSQVGQPHQPGVQLTQAEARQRHGAQARVEAAANRIVAALANHKNFVRAAPVRGFRLKSEVGNGRSLRFLR